MQNVLLNCYFFTNFFLFSDLEIFILIIYYTEKLDDMINDNDKLLTNSFLSVSTHLNKFFFQFFFIFFKIILAEKFIFNPKLKLLRPIVVIRTNFRCLSLKFSKLLNVSNQF